MGRQIWGTYSVKDHTAPGAFLADLMFYDRLVLPIPEPGGAADWHKQGWAPDRQAKLIEKLAEYDRVKTVEWKIGTWEENRASLAGQLRRDAFLYTRTKLLEDLPSGVRGITPIPTFTRSEDLARTTGLQTSGKGHIQPSPAARVVADLTLRFLVPEGTGGDEPHHLEEVLARTAEKEHKKARDAFWYWVRDYFGEDVITDEDTLEMAVKQMADLVADLQRASRIGKVKTAGQYLFLLGSVSVAFLGGPLSPAGAAGIALSVGRFGFDKFTAGAELKPTPEAALFVKSRKDLPFKTNDLAAATAATA